MPHHASHGHHGIASALSGVLLLAALAAAALPTTAGAVEARIKDIARIAGLEEIPLLGYGIVIGLRGTGDNDIELTKQTVANLLEHFKITVQPADIKSKNVAAVVVTASALPFHKAGDRIDVRVASVGDASSLEGGVLIMTPMLDPAGNVYALAQGSMTVGGYSAGSSKAGGQTVTKNHTTTGMVPSGGTLSSSQSTSFCRDGMLRLVLRHADFTTADRMAEAINKEFGALAVAHDASTVSVKVPDERIELGQTSAFVARLERLPVTPDVRARVIVNERTGTIVMGASVQVSPAVVAHGNLTVTVKEHLEASQPSNVALKNSSGVRTAITSDTSTTVEEEKARVIVLPETTTIRELADVLNMIGATPSDLVSILQALHQLGAIQMELTVM
jgi:flagellar P-ring protein precursor FlgI